MKQIIFLLFCISFLYAQNSNEWLEVTPNIHHLNKISDSKPISFDFNITNHTKQTVEILHIQTSCGCTTADKKLPIIESEQTKPVKISFDPSGRKGFARWEIIIRTSSSKQPILMATFDAEILQEGMMSKNSIAFGEFQRNTDVSQSFWISPQNMPDFQIKDIYLELKDKRNPNSFDIQIEKGIYDGFYPEPRPAYSVTLRPKKNIDFGRWEGKLIILSNIPEHEKIELPFFAKVAGEIGIRPDYISIGKIRPNTNVIKRVQVYHRNAESFQVVSVKSSVPFLKAGIATIIEDQAYQIVVSLDSKEKLPTGEFRSTVTITTTHPEMPIIDIPVQGIILPQAKKFEKK